MKEFVKILLEGNLDKLKKALDADFVGLFYDIYPIVVKSDIKGRKLERVEFFLGRLINRSKETNEIIKDFNREYLYIEGEDISIFIQTIDTNLSLVSISSKNTKFSLVKFEHDALKRKLERDLEDIKAFAEEYIEKNTELKERFKKLEEEILKDIEKGKDTVITEKIEQEVKEEKEKGKEEKVEEDYLTEIPEILLTSEIVEKDKRDKDKKKDKKSSDVSFEDILGIDFDELLKAKKKDKKSEEKVEEPPKKDDLFKEIKEKKEEKKEEEVIFTPEMFLQELNLPPSLDGEGNFNEKKIEEKEEKDILDTILEGGVDKEKATEGKEEDFFSLLDVQDLTEERKDEKEEKKPKPFIDLEDIIEEVSQEAEKEKHKEKIDEGDVLEIKNILSHVIDKTEYEDNSDVIEPIVEGVTDKTEEREEIKEEFEETTEKEEIKREEKEEITEPEIEIGEEKKESEQEGRDTLAELVKEDKSDIKYINPVVLDILLRIFSKEVGPIAKVLFRRKKRELGIDEKKLTIKALKELITALAEEIPVEYRRNRFLENAKDLL